MSYTLTQQEFRRLKTRLTRAVNSKDNDKIIHETTAALAIFEEKGYPDDWMRWQRAKEDAEFAKRRANTVDRYTILTAFVMLAGLATLVA